MQHVLDDFDITVCQIGTDGFSQLLGSTTVDDIRTRTLRMVMPLNQNAFKRMTKYWIYGYRPVPGTVDAVRNSEITEWQFTPSDGDYYGAF